MDEYLRRTLTTVVQFYDQHKVGDMGPLGFHRSTDMMTLMACLGCLMDKKIINPGETKFLDLGCGDGRVNVFLSYMVKMSVGIELDEWTLEEYGPLVARLGEILKDDSFLPLPKNIFLFHGDAMDELVYGRVTKGTGLRFEDFDLFYTYLVMHEEFAELIAEKGKKGSIFLVYGLQNILPKYKGFRLLEDMSPLERILAIYQKE